MLEENNDDFVEKMNHHIESESDEKKTTKYNVLLLGKYFKVVNPVFTNQDRLDMLVNTS